VSSSIATIEKHAASHHKAGNRDAKKRQQLRPSHRKQKQQASRSNDCSLCHCHPFQLFHILRKHHEEGEDPDRVYYYKERDRRPDNVS
jgi:hypothetical protein